MVDLTASDGVGRAMEIGVVFHPYFSSSSLRSRLFLWPIETAGYRTRCLST